MNRATHAHRRAEQRETEARLMIRDMQEAARAIRAHVAQGNRQRREAIRQMQRDLRRPSVAAGVVTIGMCLVALTTLIGVILHIARS